MSGNELRKQRVADLEMQNERIPVKENLKEKKLQLEGISKDGQEDQYTLYEMCKFDLAAMKIW